MIIKISILNIDTPRQFQHIALISHNRHNQSRCDF